MNPIEAAFQEIAQRLGVEIANHAVTRARLADMERRITELTATPEPTA